MAHFAEIDSNNIVIRVLIIPDDQEHRGQEYLSEDLGLGGRWIQTSFNHRIRNVYAGIGYSYNEELDIFIPPQPYPSWILNSYGNWEAPVSKPTDSKYYKWNENEQAWNKIDPIV